MAFTSEDPVRQALERQSADLSAKIKAGQPLLADEISQLELLSRLISIRAEFETPHRNWWPAVVLTLTLAVISLLLFARVSETDIELNLVVTELNFNLARDQVLWQPIRVDALGISGVRDISLPYGLDPPIGASALRVSSEGTRGAQGTVTLAPVMLPFDAGIGLRSTDVPRDYSIAIRAAKVDLRADVVGLLTLTFAGLPVRKVGFAAPKPIVMHSSGEQFDIDLSLATATSKPFAPQLLAQNLSLSRIDEFREGGRTSVRRISTILSGKMFFESLDGATFSIRSGQALQFGKSTGEFREFRLKDRKIEFEYRGRVSGMTTGSGEDQRSLMPTYLEWLRARHGLVLLWGSAFYLFGLALSALRWWGVYK